MTRRRLLLVGAATAALFMSGLGVAYTQTGEPSVETQTFTNVVTYTVPTVTEAGPTTTVVETVTTTETVTVTAPTTTEPPTTTTEPDPDPPALPVRPEPNITLDRVTDWNCNSPQNWPIRVNTNIPNGAGGQVNGDVQLDANCHALNAGGQDGVCDLYLNINGDGGSLGSATDAMVMRGAHDLDVCGVLGETDIDGGGGQSHKDCIQMNNAQRVHFWEVQSGDWTTKRSTCHGAGGGWYQSQLNNNPTGLVDVVCHTCVFVGGLPGNPGGVGIHFGASTDSGTVDSCGMGRSGNQGGGIRIESDNPPIRLINFNNVSANVDSVLPVPFCPALGRL